MSRIVLGYIVFLSLIIVSWSIIESGGIYEAFTSAPVISLVGIICIYGLSHIFRMMRLALLTLDKRKGIFPLTSVHVLTAFPSSLLPFKIGELLRLTAFFYVCDSQTKALAIWLSERFGDIVVISMFILLLYIFDIDMPYSLSIIFVVFIVFSILSVCIFFAASKVLVYLNRHLILSSHSKRGLVILKISHRLRLLEESIYASLEGRFIGMILLSIAIWSCEILALATFIRSHASGLEEMTRHFLMILSRSAPQEIMQTTDLFATYQTLTLTAISIIFIVIVMTIKKIKVSEQ